MVTAEVIPFPLVRRRRLVARLRQSKPGQFQHYIEKQARMLQRAGIVDDEIERQLQALVNLAQPGTTVRMVSSEDAA